MTLLADTQFLQIENAAHEGAHGNNPRALPTEAQHAAGNYKKGRLTWQGLRIAIEQPRGSYRTGRTRDGRRWSTRMAAHYGYFEGVKGADGDELDCFIGFYPQSETVFIINQQVNGRFDEHKAMLAFPDQDSAERAYRDSYERGWSGLHSIVPASISQLRWWLRNGDKSRPITRASLPYEGPETMNTPITWDASAQPRGISAAVLLYEIRRSDAGAGLLMDAVTHFDIMDDADEVIAMDAMVTPYAQVERKLEILRGVMERASATVKPVALQVTDPFKQRGVVNVAGVFELSDGQTISVYLHNPDTTPNKLAPTDELISWKWLLNKKDITIVVAPEQGEDLNVREVARRIMKLAEKNSEPFQRANKKRAGRMQAIQGLKDEIAALEVELKQAQGELEAAKVEAEDREVKAKVDDQQSTGIYYIGASRAKDFVKAQSKATGVFVEISYGNDKSKDTWWSVSDAMERINRVTGKKRLRHVSGPDVLFGSQSGGDAEKAEQMGDQVPEVGPFGPIFQGFENNPEGAIAKLMQEKQGEVSSAYTHPELGSIAFIYGNEGMGLRHIEAKRGLEWVNRIPDILRNGRLERDPKLPRAYVVQDGDPASVAVIRLDWDGRQKTWLVTAHPDDIEKWGGASKTSRTAGDESGLVQGNPSQPNPQANSTGDAGLEQVASEEVGASAPIKPAAPIDPRKLPVEWTEYQRAPAMRLAGSTSGLIAVPARGNKDAATWSIINAVTGEVVRKVQKPKFARSQVERDLVSLEERALYGAGGHYAAMQQYHKDLKAFEEVETARLWTKAPAVADVAAELQMQKIKGWDVRRAQEPAEDASELWICNYAYSKGSAPPDTELMQHSNREIWLNGNPIPQELASASAADVAAWIHVQEAVFAGDEDVAISELADRYDPETGEVFISEDDSDFEQQVAGMPREFIRSAMLVKSFTEALGGKAVFGDFNHTASAGLFDSSVQQVPFGICVQIGDGAGSVKGRADISANGDVLILAGVTGLGPIKMPDGKEAGASSKDGAILAMLKAAIGRQQAAQAEAKETEVPTPQEDPALKDVHVFEDGGQRFVQLLSSGSTPGGASDATLKKYGAFQNISVQYGAPRSAWLIAADKYLEYGKNLKKYALKKSSKERSDKLADAIQGVFNAAAAVTNGDPKKAAAIAMMQAIIDGATDPLTADLDALEAAFTGYQDDAEIAALFERAVDVVMQAEAKATGQF